MVALAPLSAFSPVTPLSPEPEHKASKTHEWLKPSEPRASSRSNLNFRANVQAPSHTKGNSFKLDDVSSRTSIIQLQDLSSLFGAITTIFTENSHENRVDDDDHNWIMDKFGISAKFVENGLVFRQNFSIRSYEVGANGTVSLETLISHLQETGLNHLKVTGLLGDGLGSTPEMQKRKLIWVATKMQIVVDRYPTWGDSIEIDNWLVLSGRNGLRRDSIIRCSKTGNILGKASSNWVMMNKETRRLCRFPDEVREEMGPYLHNVPPIVDDGNEKMPKLDEMDFDSICSGIKPRWSDLDINQHVNNAKYIGWILESAPVSILKNHQLSRMTLEYKRECHRENLLRSLTATARGQHGDVTNSNSIDCQHLLRLENGADIMKAKTQWKLQQASLDF